MIAVNLLPSLARRCREWTKAIGVMLLGAYSLVQPDGFVAVIFSALIHGISLPPRGNRASRPNTGDTASTVASV
jgi:hypothetical protein